jgi:hypothetical protein
MRPSRYVNRTVKTPVSDPTEAVIARLVTAMSFVDSDNAKRIKERGPRFGEGDMVLRMVLAVFPLVPFKVRHVRLQYNTSMYNYPY